MATRDLVIHSKTQLEDASCYLDIDVSSTAREAGFCVPVAVTNTVWNQCFSRPKICDRQDERGRLWDMLCMLYHTFNSGQSVGLEVQYLVQVKDKARPNLNYTIELLSVCSPDEDGNPRIKLMFPEDLEHEAMVKAIVCDE